LDDEKAGIAGWGRDVDRGVEAAPDLLEPERAGARRYGERQRQAAGQES
jgi:hypothetical protein